VILEYLVRVKRVSDNRLILEKLINMSLVVSIVVAKTLIDVVVSEYSCQT